MARPTGQRPRPWSRATSTNVKVVGCDPAAPSCADQFIPENSASKPSRPSADRGRGGSLQESVRHAIGGGAGGIDAVIESVLMSADFHYRPELGNGTSGVVKLTSYEIASRLSYLVLGSMPDDALFAAAKTDALQDKAAVKAQAVRLMNDLRAREAVARFHNYWLSIDRSRRSRRTRRASTRTGTTTFVPPWSKRRRCSWIASSGAAQWATSSPSLSRSWTRLSRILRRDGGHLRDNRSGRARRQEALGPSHARWLPLARGQLLRYQPGQARTVRSRRFDVRGRSASPSRCSGQIPRPAAEPDHPRTLQGARDWCLRGLSRSHRTHRPRLQNYDGIGQWRDMQQGQVIERTAR